MRSGREGTRRSVNIRISILYGFGQALRKLWTRFANRSINIFEDLGSFVRVNKINK